MLVTTTVSHLCLTKKVTNLIILFRNCHSPTTIHEHSINLPANRCSELIISNLISRIYGKEDYGFYPRKGIKKQAAIIVIDIMNSTVLLISPS